MKKNGVLCIAIAVALLVGGVAAVSASEYHANIHQCQYETQDIDNYNIIDITTGDVTTEDVDVSGNVLIQGVISDNYQDMYKSQCAGIIQIGDDTWTYDNRICSGYW